MTVVSDSLEKHSVIQIAVLKSNMTTMIRLPRLRPRDFDHWLTPFESMTVMETGPLMERVVSQGEILRVYRLLDVSSIKGFLDQKIVTSTNSPCFWWSSTLPRLHQEHNDPASGFRHLGYPFFTGPLTDPLHSDVQVL